VAIFSHPATRRHNLAVLTLPGMAVLRSFPFDPF
jgi:hypothetical protein